MSNTSPDIKAEADAVLVESTSRRPKTGRHCKRFWWVWVICFGLFVLVIMIIIVYAILPPVSQKKVDDTVLHLNTMSIMNPTVESFDFSINSTITGITGAASHARLEAFEVKLFLEGHDSIQPFMTLPVDEIHGGDNVPVVQKNIPIKIKDEAALDEFAEKLMDNDLLRIAMRGRTKMWLGKLNTKVNYNEVVTMKAFNTLKGMVITGYMLFLNDTEANIHGDVLIPNPTVVTLQMGDVSLLISLNNTLIGTGVIPNLTLRPGNHTYPFLSLINQTMLIPMAAAAGAGVPLEIGSEGTSINGTNIPWLSKPLMKLTTLVPINTQH